MQLLDQLVLAQMAGDQLDFLFQALQIRLRPTTVLGDDLVAAAVVADVGAEGQMDVQRQRAGRLAAAAQGVEQIERTDLVIELGRGRVLRVARAGLIVTTDQVGIPANGVEHVAFPVMTAVAGF